MNEPNFYLKTMWRGLLAVVLCACFAIPARAQTPTPDSESWDMDFLGRFGKDISNFRDMVAYLLGRPHRVAGQ